MNTYSLPKLPQKKKGAYKSIGVGGEQDDGDDLESDPIKSPHDLYLNTTELEKAYYVNRAQELRKKEFVINDYILKDLDADHLSSMKHEFYKRSNAVSIPEFIQIMRSQLQWSVPAGSGEETLVVTRLCELFREIDVDNSGDITWHEFTTYIIKNGFVEIMEPIKQYVPCKLEYDIPVHTPDKVAYISALDKLLVCDRGKVVRIYKPMRSKVQVEYMPWKELSGHVGNIVGMEYIDEGGGTFVTAGTDNKLFLWDCAISWRYAKQHHTFFVGSMLGSIAAYTIEHQSVDTAPTPTGSHVISPLTYTEDEHKESNIANISPRKKKTTYTWNERGFMRAHTDMVMDMALITNTPTLASCGMDSGIFLWDMNTLAQTQRLHGHSKGVLSLAYSSDYRVLVSAGFERDALVWNPVVNRILYRLKGHYSSLVATHAVEGTPQADKMGTVKVWDIRTFECVQTIPVTDCPDSTSLTSCHRRILLGAFDLAREEKPSKPYLSEDAALVCCLYNAHSNTILTAAGTGVKVWDAKSGMLLRAHEHISPHQITSVCFESGQRKIFVGNAKGDIRVHHYGNGSLIATLEPHNSEVSALIYSAPRQCLLSTGQDALLRMHDTLGRVNKSVVKSVHCGTKDISAAIDSIDQGLLACATAADNSIRLWDVERWGMEAVFRELHAEITSLAFLDPFPVFVCGDSAGFITFFSIRPSRYKNQRLLRFNTNEQPLPPPPLNSNSKSTNPLEDKSTSTSTKQVPGICSLAFPRDGSLLYSGNELGTITAWDLSDFFQKGGIKTAHWNLRKPYTTEVDNELDDAAYAVPVLEASDITAAYSWPAHSNAVTTLCMVESPPALLSGSRDCRVRAWSRVGEYYGSLRQAPTGGKWTFPLNDEALARIKSEHARQVLDTVNTMDTQPQETPPAPHAQFLSKRPPLSPPNNVRPKSRSATPGPLSRRSTGTPSFPPVRRAQSAEPPAADAKRKDKGSPKVQCFTLTESQERASIRLNSALSRALSKTNG